MKNKIIDFIFKHQYDIFKPVFFLRKYYKDRRIYLKYSDAINSSMYCDKSRLFYCGIPVHGNLGDLAQGVCIREWIKKHYSKYQLVEIETDALVNTRFSVLGELKKAYQQNDIIIFQSGYTTTDLGGWADSMHQEVLKAIPHAKVLMMPQTIFFKSESRKKRCSEIYNAHKSMLYLARDKVSYEMAKEMFPNIPTLCYPDIVTTLIGSYENKKNRDGIIFCLRDDGEKLYSDKELEVLLEKCASITNIKRTDTTKNKNVVKNAKEFIYSEIETYSKFKVMITDRYHGTILSLVANTPVIILKTTDHKVVTGANWFKGIYDSHVYLAEDLDDAYRIARDILNGFNYYRLKPYFEEQYYDKLPMLFKEKIG